MKSQTLTLVIALLTTTHSIPNHEKINSIPEPEYDFDDLELVPSIPEELQALTFLLSTNESSEIYVLNEESRRRSPGPDKDYVILPIRYINHETGKRVFEPFMVRVTILNLDSEASYPQMKPLEKPDLQEDKVEGETTEVSKGPDTLQDPEENSFAIIYPPSSLPAPRVDESTPSPRFSEEVRRPKVIVPRDGGSSRNDHWTARFLSCFTIILYGALMVLFILFIILNCCCTNVSRMFGSTVSLNEVRVPIPSATFGSLSNSKRRAYYERI